MKKYILVLAFSTLFFTQNTFAKCDWSCKSTIKTPVGKITIQNPACDANKLACRGKLAGCIATSLLAYGVSGVCVASVVALYTTAGTSWEAAALVCGVAADTIFEATNHC